MNVTVTLVCSFKQLSILMCKFKLIGRSILIFSGIILFLAGFLKLINVGAEDMIEGLDKAGLLKLRFPISIISIFCGVLLIIPKASIVGVLFASAYWGGAIVAHLTYSLTDAIVLGEIAGILFWMVVGFSCLAFRLAHKEVGFDS